MILEFVCLIITIFGCSLEAANVVDQHPDEEYVISHEILYKDAIEEAKKLDIYPAGMDGKGPIPGCKSCDSDEISYCRDGRVVNDHCCCDNAPENDVFRFMPHVCHIGPEACKVHAGDCAEYTRLRQCCCDAYQAEIWKNIANRGSTIVNYFQMIIIAGVFFIKLFLF